MPAEDVTIGKLLLVEYERVKDEQKTRIGFRDNLIYATLASVAAVIAATLSNRGQINLLLLIPPVSIFLGWTYLVNDVKISAAGRYIRTILTPRFSALVADEHGAVFAWEEFHRTDSRRSARKVLQLSADLSIFCLSPLAALFVFWVVGSQGFALMLISFFEAIAVVLLALQIVLYADLKKPGIAPKIADGESSPR